MLSKTSPRSEAITLAVIVTILISVSTGCERIRSLRRGKEIPTAIVATPTPSNAFVSAHYSQLRPHRVAIVTPANRMQEFHEQDQFAEALAFSLRQHGVFETVVGSRVPCNLNAIQSGRYDEQQLVNLASQYNADAILYCDVTSFSAYDPLTASVAISIIDARESVVLFCSDGTWNLRDTATSNGFRNFLQRGGADYSIDSRLESPSEFVGYIADSTADFISKY
jgi:hypothetical protein